jgi:hypothetical protein
MVYEDWLHDYFQHEPEEWECALDGEDLHEAWNAGWEAGVEYIRNGGSFK